MNISDLKKLKKEAALTKRGDCRTLRDSGKHGQ